MQNNTIPPLVQSTLSHYVAIRDKAIAELDACFNSKATNTNVSLTDRVNVLFKELYEANGILKTIEETLKLENAKNPVDNISTEKKK